jgi:hypothetical protein
MATKKKATPGSPGVTRVWLLHTKALQTSRGMLIQPIKPDSFTSIRVDRETRSLLIHRDLQDGTMLHVELPLSAVVLEWSTS